MEENKKQIYIGSLGEVSSGFILSVLDEDPEGQPPETIAGPESERSQIDQRVDRVHSLCHSNTPQLLYFVGMGYSQQWGVAF